MNPWAILGVIALWAGSIAGTAHWFFKAGSDSELASQGREDKIAAKAADAAASAAAQAISKITIKHQTIKQEVEREIQTRDVYKLAECNTGPDSLRLFNSAISASASSLDPSGVPRKNPSD